MGYEPQLIIKFDDLKKIETELDRESYGETDIDGIRVAEFLLFYLKNEHIQPIFEDKKIIITDPEGSHFNSLVRDRLDEGNVYYITN